MQAAPSGKNKRFTDGNSNLQIHISHAHGMPNDLIFHQVLLESTHKDL